jgi:HEAT repeat protein
VIKEVADVFEVDRASKSIGRIRTSNISLTVYMKRGVLLWLGKAGHEQAFSLLKKLYDQADDEHLRMRLVGRIGNTDHPQAISFFNEVLQKDKSARVRKEAVDELDAYHSREALAILVRTARYDPSDVVRCKAVESISDIELSAAEDALIEIAKTGPSPSVRREAIDKVRDISTAEAMDCLVSIIDKQDEVYKIRLEALEALTDIEKDGVLDTLIRIAQTHADPRIRLEAIDQLSDWDSPEVVDCLNRIVNKKGELYQIQEEALEKLTDIEEDRALDLLVQIVKTHTHPQIRREGINRLSDIDELRLTAFPRAIDCLVFVVNNKDEVERNRLEALDALADIGNHRAMDELIRVAGNHIHPRMREEALEHLIDMDELSLRNIPKVIKCFQSIIDNPAEHEKIQRQALDALKEIEHQDVQTYITKIARSHPKQKVRREAQEIVAEWIRDS